MLFDSLILTPSFSRFANSFGSDFLCASKDNAQETTGANEAR